jgi:hypothetical protein
MTDDDDAKVRLPPCDCALGKCHPSPEHVCEIERLRLHPLTGENATVSYRAKGIRRLHARIDALAAVNVRK